uniref:Uncharacterized protein n=2 Tax=viral metagenome TaxID=1070528 RepID=A0A6M3JBP1_9ZZZZ
MPIQIIPTVSIGIKELASMESWTDKRNGKKGGRILMGFSFAMNYHPDYQRRYGECKICHQGIEVGSKIIVGTGYFNHHLVRVHNHYDCWLEELERRAKDWFFKNNYEPKRMSPDKKAELNRLRAKRYYIKKIGGEPNEVAEKLMEVERRIAMVKAG